MRHLPTCESNERSESEKNNEKQKIENTKHVKIIKYEKLLNKYHEGAEEERRMSWNIKTEKCAIIKERNTFHSLDIYFPLFSRIEL